MRPEAGFGEPLRAPVLRPIHLRVNPAYFETRFRTLDPERIWPERFVIVSAYATTGTSWSAERNEAADRRLQGVLQARTTWVRRLTGYSPTTGHAEPGWAADLPFEEACDLGRAFLQDAIYVVLGDELLVSRCDERRRPEPVGSFRERLDAHPTSEL